LTLGLVPVEYRYARVKNLCDGADFAKKLGITDVVTHMGFIPENPYDPNFPGFCRAVRVVAEHLKRNEQYLLFETGQETPVTLLRCFGTAVSGYESVDGQQPGVSTFRFGLLPLTAEDKDADIQRRLDAFTAGVRYRDDHTWREDAALENRSFYRLDGENTVFSTLKVAEDGEGLCLRVFNMSDTPETATLTFDRVPAEAALVNLEECHPVALAVDGTAVAVEMPAWAIRTVYLKF
jgi:alpha-mannosidase